MSSIGSSAGTEARGHARLRLGTCPDSWGVWFADDPLQTPWGRFLDEVAEVGYEWLELGPFGYLPTDPVRLTEELGRRGLKVAGRRPSGSLTRPIPATCRSAWTPATWPTGTRTTWPSSTATRTASGTCTGYLAMKATLEDGGIGAPLLMHCSHRNPSVPPYGFTTEMIISDSSVHEIDLVRWLFGEEIVAASVFRPRRSRQAPDGLQDPLILQLEMASGVLVDDELFISAQYGYDVRGEVVCESGTVALADVSEVRLRAAGRHGGRVPVDWRDRFIRAYDAELQDWLTAVAAGTSTGPTAWDGFAAAAVTDSCLEALRTGTRTAVSLPERPDFYAKAP